MSRFKLVLVCALAVMAVGGAASASSASARQFIGCLKVISGTGGYEDPVCTKPGGTKEYVRAIVGANQHWWGCFMVPAGKGKFSEPTCEVPGPPEEWELEDTQVPAKVTGTSKAKAVSVLKSELDGVPISIVCQKNKVAGTLEVEGKSSSTKITYEECAIEGSWAKKCEVPSTISTNSLKDQLSSSGRIEDTFEPEGTNFVEIEIKAISGKTCSIATTYPIKGSQTCEIDKSNTEAETLKEEHETICKTSGSNLKLGPESATYEGTDVVKLESGGYWAVE